MMVMDILRQVIGHKQERAQRFFSFDCHEVTRWAELTAEHKIRDIDTSAEYSDVMEWLDTFKNGIKADFDLKSSLLYRDKTMADYEKELSTKHGESHQPSSLHEPLTPTEQGSSAEQDEALNADGDGQNSTASINEALKAQSKIRKDSKQDSGNCALVLNCGGEVPASAVDYVTSTLQSEGRNDTARQFQHRKHLIDVDDETVLTLAARFNVDPMHLLSLVQQNKKDFYKLSKIKCPIDSPLKRHISVDLPVSTVTRYLVCPKSVEGWYAWLSTTDEAFKAGNMDIYITDSQNQTYSSLNMQRDNYLVSFDMVAIESLGQRERDLIQSDLKFARDRLHYFFSGWWRCEFCNECFQSLAETTEHEEICSKADPKEIQARKLKGRPDIGFANATPCGNPDEREKMEDTARAFLEAVVDEDLTWRTSLPAEAEGEEFTLFHLFRTVFPSCAHPTYGLKIEDFNDLAKELFPVRENVFPGIKKVFLGASLRDVKEDDKESKFWKTFVNCLGVSESRVEEIQDIIVQQKEAWETHLDELLKKLPSHMEFLSLKNPRKLPKSDSGKKQPKKPEQPSPLGKAKDVELANPAAAVPSDNPHPNSTPAKTENAKTPPASEPYRVGDWVMLHSLKTNADYNSRIGQVEKWDEKKKMFHVKLIEGKKCALKSANLTKVPGPNGTQQPPEPDCNPPEPKQDKNIKITVCLNEHTKFEISIMSSSKVSEIIDKVQALETTENAGSFSALHALTKQGQKPVIKRGEKSLPLSDILSQLDVVDGDEVMFEMGNTEQEQKSESNVDVSKGFGSRNNATKDDLTSTGSDRKDTTTQPNLGMAAATSGTKSSSKEASETLSTAKAAGQLQPKRVDGVKENDPDKKPEISGSKLEGDTAGRNVSSEKASPGEMKEASTEDKPRQSVVTDSSNPPSAMEIDGAIKPEVAKKKDDDVPMSRTKRTVSTNKVAGSDVQSQKPRTEVSETEGSTVDVKSTEEDVSKNKVKKSAKGKPAEGPHNTLSDTKLPKESETSASGPHSTQSADAVGEGPQDGKALQEPSKADESLPQITSKSTKDADKAATSGATPIKDTSDREKSPQKRMEASNELAGKGDNMTTAETTHKHEQTKNVKRSKPNAHEVSEDLKARGKVVAHEVNSQPSQPHLSAESDEKSKAEDVPGTHTSNTIPLLASDSLSSPAGAQGHVQSKTKEKAGEDDHNDDVPIATLVGTKGSESDRDQGLESDKSNKQKSRSKKSKDNGNEELSKAPGKPNDNISSVVDTPHGEAGQTQQTANSKPQQGQGSGEKVGQNLEAKTSAQVLTGTPIDEHNAAKPSNAGKSRKSQDSKEDQTHKVRKEEAPKVPEDKAPKVEEKSLAVNPTTNAPKDSQPLPPVKSESGDKKVIEQSLTRSVLSLIHKADEISVTPGASSAETPEESKKVEPKAATRKEAEKEICSDAKVGKDGIEEHAERQSNQGLNASFISLDNSMDISGFRDEIMASDQSEKAPAPSEPTAAEEIKESVTSENLQKSGAATVKHAADQQHQEKAAEGDWKVGSFGTESIESGSHPSNSAKRKRSAHESSKTDESMDKPIDSHRPEVTEQTAEQPIPTLHTMSHDTESDVKKSKDTTHAAADKKASMTEKDSSEKENSRETSSENTEGAKTQRRRQTSESGRKSGSALSRNNHDEEEQQTTKKRNRRESNDEAEEERQSTRSKRRCVMTIEKERQAEKERQQSLKKYIGMEVQKEFDGVMYRGKVVRISYDRTKKGPEAEDFFNIVYEDDDREQMDFQELQRYLVRK